LPSFGSTPRVFKRDRFGEGRFLPNCGVAQTCKKERPAILTDIVQLFGGNYITCEREIRGREFLYCRTANPPEGDKCVRYAAGSLPKSFSPYRA
jgi:hypothetical protein